ncbi:MAG: PAS domain S-box protein [Fimbriimonadaceae bacterium]|nr:PAS domain S-box protein [Fimbriimonadaceae bacterium]
MLRLLTVLRRGRGDLVNEALEQLTASGSNLARHEAEYLVKTSYNAFLVALSQGETSHFEEQMAALADREARAGNALRVEAAVLGLDTLAAQVRDLHGVTDTGDVDPVALLEAGRTRFLSGYLRAKAAEDERRATALANYAEAAEDVPSLVYSTDIEGRITDINHLAAELLGYRKADLIGQHHSILMRPEDAERFSYFIQERRTDDRATRRARIHLQAADGSLREFEVSSTGVYDQDGRYIGSDGMARTVTGEVTALEYQLDSDGRFQEVSPAAAAVLGFTPAELLGQHFAAIMDPRERERVGRMFGERRTDDRAAKAIRVALTGRDGARREFEISAVGRYGDDGAFLGTVGLGSDITSRSELERAVAEGRRKYRSLFDQAGMGLALITPDLVVRDANAWHYQRRRRQVTGSHCYIGLFGNSDACPWCGLREALDRDEPVLREDVPGSLDGRRYSLLFAPIVDADGQRLGVLEAVIDVTAEREARERTVAAERQEAVWRLAGGLATPHDTALTVLALQAARSGDRGLREAAEAAVREARRLSRFAAAGMGCRASCDLNAVVRQELASSSFPATVDVEADLLPTLPPVALAASDAAELLRELLRNAVEALADGGPVTIETSRHDGQPVVLRVTDSGPGMSEAALRQAVDPFFSTKPGHQGLGLSLVVGVARGVGGRVELTAGEGAGTCVEVYLPVGAAEPSGDLAAGLPGAVRIELPDPLGPAVSAALAAAGVPVAPADEAASVRIVSGSCAVPVGPTVVLGRGPGQPGPGVVLVPLPCTLDDLLGALARVSG